MTCIARLVVALAPGASWPWWNPVGFAAFLLGVAAAPRVALAARRSHRAGAHRRRLLGVSASFAAVLVLTSALARALLA